MDELATELPAGSLAYQSRAERIEADIADASSYEALAPLSALLKTLSRTLSCWM
jgi:hypothetical protein